MQWRWKWGEEKGQYGDVDLFVDCKEGDSIEWILRSNLYWPGGCRKVDLLFRIVGLCCMKTEDDKEDKIMDGLVWRYHLYWAEEYREHRAFQCCPRSQTCEMCTLSSWSTRWKEAGSWAQLMVAANSVKLSPKQNIWQKGIPEESKKK